MYIQWLRPRNPLICRLICEELIVGHGEDAIASTPTQNAAQAYSLIQDASLIKTQP
jgi:hypothetical protein